MSKGKPLLSPLTNVPITPDLVPSVMARRLVADYVEEKLAEQEKEEKQG